MAFLALCVLPTLVLAGSVGWRAWPGRHDAVLASLGRQLGGRLTAERVATPKPGLWRAEGLVLADPETDTPIAELSWIEFRSGDRIEGRGGELRVLDPQSIAAGSDRLLRDDWPGEVRLAFEQFTIKEGGSEAAWGPIDARLATLQEDDERAVRRLHAGQRGGAAFVQADRRRGPSAPRTEWRVDTGTEAVAWRWLVPLGRASTDEAGSETFRGRAGATLSRGRAEVHASGAVAGLLPARFLGHDGLKLRTQMTVELKSLRMVNGRVVEMNAGVSAGSGQIDRDLFLTMVQRLGCRYTPALEERWNQPTGPTIGFDRLAFGVSLDATGCTLSGDALLASARGALLLAPADGRAPIDALPHLAAPSAERYQPAAVSLAARLPLAAGR